MLALWMWTHKLLTWTCTVMVTAVGSVAVVVVMVIVVDICSFA